MTQAIDEKSDPWSLPRISSYIYFTLILLSSTLFTFLFLFLSLSKKVPLL